MIERVDYTAMTEGNAMPEACGADAMKWAIAFCQHMRKNRWTATDIDEGLMVAWFANAIEEACRVRQAIS